MSEPAPTPETQDTPPEDVAASTQDSGTAEGAGELGDAATTTATTDTNNDAVATTTNEAAATDTPTDAAPTAPDSNTGSATDTTEAAATVVEPPVDSSVAESEDGADGSDNNTAGDAVPTDTTPVDTPVDATTTTTAAATATTASTAGTAVTDGDTPAVVVTDEDNTDAKQEEEEEDAAEQADTVGELPAATTTTTTTTTTATATATATDTATTTESGETQTETESGAAAGGSVQALRSRPRAPSGRRAASTKNPARLIASQEARGRNRSMSMGSVMSHTNRRVSGGSSGASGLGPGGPGSSGGAGAGPSSLRPTSLASQGNVIAAAAANRFVVGDGTREALPKLRKRANSMSVVEHKAQLYHVKGRRRVRVLKTYLSYEALNSGDVFVLDAGDTIFQWNGSGASMMEKAKGLDLALNIKDKERSSRAKVVTLTEGSNDTGRAAEPFWAALGGHGDVAPASAVDDDVHFEKDVDAHTALFEVHGDELSLVATGKLTHSLLGTNGVYIVDSVGGVYVWMGRHASTADRKAGMAKGRELLAEGDKPAWATVTKVNEGGEVTIFKEKFAVWPENPNILAVKNVVQGKIKSSSEIKAEKKLGAIDVARMRGLSNVIKSALIRQLPTEVEGTFQIWKMKDMDKEPVPDALKYHMFESESYVVLYTYERYNEPAYIIFYWQGRSAHNLTKGTAAHLAVDIQSHCKGEAEQHRQTQGAEAPLFLKLFEGKLFVHTGDSETYLTATTTTTNNNDDEQTSESTPTATRMYHAMGTEPGEFRITQTLTAASSLSSKNSYVVRVGGVAYVWYGAGSPRTERELTLAAVSGAYPTDTVVEVEEGREGDEFWAAIGGKGEYANAAFLANPTRREGVLYGCTRTETGWKGFVVKNYTQDSLSSSEVFLLDGVEQVFVWTGEEASVEQKKAMMDAAVEYENTAADGRSKSNELLFVEQGAEPPLFTCFFHAWNAPHYGKNIHYHFDEEEGEGGGGEGDGAGAGASGEDTVAPLPNPATAAVRRRPRTLSIADKMAELDVKVIPYDELVAMKNAGNLPEGVDSRALQNYLAPDEFEAVFAMPQEEFDKLAGWKQTNLKKKVDLF